MKDEDKNSYIVTQTRLFVLEIKKFDVFNIIKEKNSRNISNL